MRARASRAALPALAAALPAFALVAGLAACAGPAPAAAPGPAAGIAAVPGAPLAGRFSLVAASGVRHEAWSGRYAFRDEGGLRQVDLASPLGATLARCEWGPRGARLSVPEGAGLRTEEGPDAQALALRLLGWPLPIELLPDWMAGRPGSGVPAQAATQDGSVDSFTQAGWTVKVERPAPGANPVRIELDRIPRGEDDPLRIRLRILPDPA